jgi:ABC-type sugar transport system substrate-binding protein
MEKDPAARFPDVETMTSAMNDTISALFERIEDIKPTITAPTPSGDEAQADAQRRASPLVAASLVITGIVVLVAFVVMVVYAPVPVSVILEGQSAAAEQIDPTPREIANARRQLGETGFIAYTACNPLAPTDVARIEHFQARADQYGLPLRVYDSQGNPMDEIRALQQAHTDGASAIIHCTIGTTTVGNAVASVTADDVPLIMDSAAPGGGDLEDAVFVADNDYALGEASGRAAGTYIQNEHNGNATVLLLDATPTDELSARARGLRTGVLAAAPGTTLLGVYAGGANTETARETMGDLIGDEVAFDVILTVTDNGAYGAINALEFAGYMPNEVAIFSVGGEQLAQQYIAAGEFIRATARTDADAVSSAMFNAAVELLGGGAVTEYILPSVEVLTAEDVGNG